MTHIAILAGCVAAALAVAGCTRTEIKEQAGTTAAQSHSRPERVVVYDFASAAVDLPPDSAIARLHQERATPQSEQQIAAGRRLGELTSTYLVEALNKAGIPAVNGSTGALLRPGDAVVRGEFVTVDEGSATKRMLIGFGSGAAELETLVEAYEVTETGLVPLGSAKIDTAGGQMPGILVPVSVGAAIGSAATSAAVSGTANVLQEAGPESVEGAAKRTAAEIAKLAVEEWKKRGWL